MTSDAGTTRALVSTLVSLLLATILVSTSARAQDGVRERFPSPAADQIPASGPFDPITVANVVVSWRVLDVANDGALWVEADGQTFELELWPIALAPSSHPAGEQGRRYLASLIDREVQFSFHQHDDVGAKGMSQPPSRRAYADVVSVLIKRGLARYCPDSGIRFGELERLEQEAKKNKRGVWSGPSPLTCP